MGYRPQMGLSLGCHSSILHNLLAYVSPKWRKSSSHNADIFCSYVSWSKLCPRSRTEQGSAPSNNEHSPKCFKTSPVASSKMAASHSWRLLLLTIHSFLNFIIFVTFLGHAVIFSEINNHLLPALKFPLRNYWWVGVLNFSHRVWFFITLYHVEAI